MQLEILAPSRLDLDQPQDHVGVILARSAHGPHAVDNGSLDLDEAFASVALHGHRAEPFGSVEAMASYAPSVRTRRIISGWYLIPAKR